MMTYLDVALLKAEWAVGGCPVCSAPPPAHAPGCELDLALAERGFATQPDRDRARGRLASAAAPTEQPPPPPAAGEGTES
jgi:hypothetical protein